MGELLAASGHSRRASKRWTQAERATASRSPFRGGWSAVFLPLTLGTGGLIAAAIMHLAVPYAEQPASVNPLMEIRDYRVSTIAAPPPSTYVVAEGDTLFDIADGLGSSVEALVYANNLDDFDLLTIGQVLMVPPSGSTRQPTDPTRTLAEVAATYGLDAQVLGAYNAIAADRVSQPIGREALLFPAGATPQGLASADQATERVLVGSIPFGAERAYEPFVYRVRPGDTLTDVAWRLGIDVDTILNNNEVADGDRIKIGDELLVLPISGLLYKVEEGDSLTGIADKFGVDVDPILELNGLALADDIERGMELLLPGAGPVVYAPSVPRAVSQPGVARLMVPYRSQLDGTPWAGANCGPTALGMGLESLGIKISSTELRRQTLNSQGIWGNNVGTLMDALARVAANNGARPVGLYDGNRIGKWSTKDLREQLEAGRPVITQVRFRALPGRAGVRYYADHYIILTGVSGDKFFYNDPLNSDGPGADRVMTAAQLEAAMNASDTRYAYAAFALAR